MWNWPHYIGCEQRSRDDISGRPKASRTRQSPRQLDREFMYLLTGAQAQGELGNFLQNVHSQKNMCISHFTNSYYIVTKPEEVD